MIMAINRIKAKTPEALDPLLNAFHTKGRAS